MGSTVNICTMHFKEHLSLTQARCLRGAIVSLVGRDHQLFHNHRQSGLRYGYPLVQYKVIDGHGAIVGIGDAAAEVMNLATHFPCELMLGEREVALSIDNCQLVPYSPVFDIQHKLYSLTNYLPLNEENIKKYNAMLALTDKISFIEDILTANILAFLKGINYYAQEQIALALTSLQEPQERNYKRVKFVAFDLQFVANIELPDNIGLGKSSSIGFGTLKRLPLPRHFKMPNPLGEMEL